MPAKVGKDSSTEKLSLIKRRNNIHRNHVVNYLHLITDLVYNVRFVALMVFAFFQCLGATLLLVVFGVWLKEEYGFDSTQVGNTVLSLSIGELIGFAVSFMLTDFLGCLPSLYLATIFEFIFAFIFFVGQSFGFKTRVVLIVLHIAGTELAFLCSITWSSKISNYTFVVVTCLFAIFAVGRGVIDVLSPRIWSFAKDDIEWSTMSVIMILIGVLMLFGTFSIVIGEYLHKQKTKRYNIIPHAGSLEL